MTHCYYYPQIDSYIILATNTMIEDDVAMMMYWGSGFLDLEQYETGIGEIEQLIGASG